MRNQTIEIAYDGDYIKGILKINGEEIPVYLTEIASKPLQSGIDWRLPYKFLCCPEEKYERTFTFKEIL